MKEKWKITARSWNDIIGNGVLDLGEPPIEYVRILLDDRYILSTNAEGIATAYLVVSTSQWARESDTFLISIEAPQGYLNTTPDRLEIDGRTQFDIIDFGLQVDPAFPLPGEREHRALECREYPGLPTYVEEEIKVLETLSDGTVLTSIPGDNGSGQHLYRLDFQQERWVKNFGPPVSTISWLTGTSLSDLWAHANRIGLFHFDGNDWTLHEGAKGLGGNRLSDMAILGDGTLWASDGHRGMSFLSPGADWWERVPQIYTPDMEGLQNLHVTQDGTLWSVGASIIHFFPSIETDDGDDALDFNFGHDALDYNFPRLPESFKHSSVDSVLTSDGIIWIVRTITNQTRSESHFYRFDTQVKIFEEISYENSAGAMPPVPFHTISLAKDGSIWAHLPSLSPVVRTYEAWPLVHFIPDPVSAEGTWIIHEAGSLPIHGTVETVDSDGGVWLLAQSDVQRHVRCVEPLRAAQ